MYLNQLGSAHSRLDQILNVLKNNYGFSIAIDMDQPSAESTLLEYKTTYQNHIEKIVNESSFNSYQQNPQYVKNLLILEAIQLLLTEIAPKRRKGKIKENRMTMADYIQNAITATGSYGTSYYRVGDALKEIGSNIPSFHVSKEVRALISKAWEAYKQVPRDTNGSDAYDAVHTALVAAGQQLYKDSMPASEQPPVTNVEKSIETPPKKTATRKRTPSKKSTQNKNSSSEINADVNENFWDDMKKSARDFWNGTPDELEQEKKDKDAYARYVADRKERGEELDEKTVDHRSAEQLIKLGQAMVDYASENQSSDDDQLRMLNAFSRVGEKLIGSDQPFNDGLTDTEKKVARYALLKLKSTGMLPKEFNASLPMTTNESIDANHSYEFGASMARSELYRNAKYAMSLMKQVDPHGSVDFWIAETLEKAAKTLDKIYHHIEYGSTFEPVDTLSEEDDDNEKLSGQFIRHLLSQIVDYSMKIFELIPKNAELENWIEMNLTAASESVSSVKHHMDHQLFSKHGVNNHISEGLPMNRKNKKLMEQDLEGLAKAQTILAAKDMSSKLQGMAEDVAKMSVEDLMPLVDVMRSQFGQESADGFNQIAKGAFEQLLNATTQTKESFDSAIETLNTGGVPQKANDLSNAPAPGAVPASPDDSGMDKDLEDLAGNSEPLGRAKKEPMAEAWDKKGKGPNHPEDVGKWKDKTIAELKATKANLMKKKKRTAKEQTKVREINFAIRSKQNNKWGKVAESKKTMKCTECNNMFEGNKSLKKCTDHKNMKVVSENVTIGMMAESYINANLKAFNEKYGTSKGQNYLYATVWEKFGPKSESYVHAVSKLAETKNLITAFESKLVQHKKEFKQSLKEGATIDPLNIGHGLQGDLIIGRINELNEVSSKLKATIRKEIEEGAVELFDYINQLKLDKKLASIKESTPYGVIFKTKNGRKGKKMFESIETRNYWVDLKKNTLTDISYIEPETFDKASGKLA